MRWGPTTLALVACTSVLVAARLTGCGGKAVLIAPPDAGWACRQPDAGIPPAPACDAAAQCQAWGQSVAAGANVGCPDGTCTLTVPVAPCDPGPSGDAKCQALYQALVPNAYAYGKCIPGTGSMDRMCASADHCSVADNSGASYDGEGACWCGSAVPSPASTLPGLCIDVDGTPTYATICQ